MTWKKVNDTKNLVRWDNEDGDTVLVKKWKGDKEFAVTIPDSMEPYKWFSSRTKAVRFALNYIRRHKNERWS